MKTFGSLFSGGGGADIGARAAGLELAWANEYDPAIAEVYAANLGNHIVVGDMLNLNPFDFEWVNHMHLSPPCTRASVANSSAEINEDGLKESQLDIALANKCIQFIEALRPDSITLENVWAYRKFQSWKGGKKCEGIQQALYRLGYWLSVEHVNFADLSVPQTRRRMIVRAIRGGMVPYLPQAERWVGWYESISDIIDTLPDSQFASWQLERLPEELKTMLIAQGKYGDNLVIASQYEPTFTITANSNQTRLKALLVSNAKTEYSDGTRTGDDPAFTGNSESNGRVKEFVIDGMNSRSFGDGPTCLNGENPIFTIQASQAKGMPRAYDGIGRVVAMTTRALARFQSFPDQYLLPESKTLAAKVIGNAVPPLGFQKIIGGLL